MINLTEVEMLKRFSNIVISRRFIEGRVIPGTYYDSIKYIHHTF